MTAASTLPPLDHLYSASPQWQSILDPGEALLWQGRPDAGPAFVLGHALRLIRSAVMLALFYYLVRRVGYGIASYREVQVIVLAIFFLPVPLDLIKSMITRRMQRYALTPARAIIVTDLGPFGRSIRSVPLTGATPLTLLRGPNWSSIWFTPVPKWYSGLVTPPSPLGFERIAEAEQVFALMRHPT